MTVRERLLRQFDPVQRDVRLEGEPRRETDTASEGGELFVVYTEGRDTSSPNVTALQNRGLVVKINKLLRF